jgi:hypothetical protein
MRLIYISALFTIIAVNLGCVSPIVQPPPAQMRDTLYQICPHCGWDTTLFLHTDPIVLKQKYKNPKRK